MLRFAVMKKQSPAAKSFLAIASLGLVGGLAALVLQAASGSGAGHRDARACQAALAAYERAMALAESAAGAEDQADLLAARQRGYDAARFSRHASGAAAAWNSSSDAAADSSRPQADPAGTAADARAPAVHASRSADHAAREVERRAAGDCRIAGL